MLIKNIEYLFSRGYEFYCLSSSLNLFLPGLRLVQILRHLSGYVLCYVSK